jgi:uncharacterized repeat protein (TIGR04052 family)
VTIFNIGPLEVNMMSFSKNYRPFLCALVLFPLLGCKDKDSSSTSQDLSVEIPFVVRAGDAELNCSTSASSIGLTQSTIEARDMRFYIHQPTLVTASGEEVAITLDQDKTWQRDAVALLDFADGQGLCDPASPETNTVLRGKVAPGDYKGFKFQLGLPPSLNHLDAATEPAPFNYPGMWWSWKGGYKFARFDFKSSGQPTFFFHFGATSCSGSIEAGFSCASNNSAIINIDGFDLGQQAVVFDVKTLFADVDLDAPVNFASGDVIKGCMAFSKDPECDPIFQKLGLRFELNAEAPAQTAFTLIQRP